MRERTQPTIAPEAIVAALSQITDPDLGRDIVTLGFVKDLKIDGENVSFAIELTTPACPVRDQMKEDAQRAVRFVRCHAARSRSPQYSRQTNWRDRQLLHRQRSPRLRIVCRQTAPPE